MAEPADILADAVAAPIVKTDSDIRRLDQSVGIWARTIEKIGVPSAIIVSFLIAGFAALGFAGTGIAWYASNVILPESRSRIESQEEQAKSIREISVSTAQTAKAIDAMERTVASFDRTMTGLLTETKESQAVLREIREEQKRTGEQLRGGIRTRPMGE